MVNCIILGRAESFAYKNGIGASALDGIFQGLGYTMVLVIMCVVREFLGNGTIMGGLLEIGAEGQLVFGLGTAAGIRILPEGIPALGMILPVGGFLTLACVIAAMQYILNKPKKGDKRLRRWPSNGVDSALYHRPGPSWSITLLWPSSWASAPSWVFPKDRDCLRHGAGGYLRHGPGLRHLLAHQ